MKEMYKLKKINSKKYTALVRYYKAIYFDGSIEIYGTVDETDLFTGLFKQKNKPVRIKRLYCLKFAV